VSDIEDQVAEIIWGVLLVAEQDRLTEDLSIIAHAAAKNLEKAGLLIGEEEYNYGT